MCKFITLVVPTGEVDSVRAVMDQYERAAVPIDNASIRQVLRDGEHQFLTTRGHCDCNTVLGQRHRITEVSEEQLAREEQRLLRKGWSAAKISRSIENRKRAYARPKRLSPDTLDSLELWHAILTDLGRNLGLPHAGLLVADYSGPIGDEVLTARRLELSKDCEWQDALGLMENAELTIFPLRGRMGA